MRHLGITAVFFLLLAVVVKSEATPTQTPSKGIVVVARGNDYRGYSRVGGFRRGDIENAVCGALSEYFESQGTQVLNQIPPTARVWNKELGIYEFRLPPSVREMWLIRATSTGIRQDSPDLVGTILWGSGLGQVRTQRCDISIEAEVLSRQGKRRIGPFVGTGKSQEIRVNEQLIVGYKSGSLWKRMFSIQSLAARAIEMLLSRMSNVEAQAFEKAWTQFVQAVWPEPPVQTTTSPSRQRGTTNPGRRELPVIRPD